MGSFKKSRAGYAEVLNGWDLYNVCSKAGAAICSKVNGAGHGTYVHDTQRGKTRIHTRIKTADSKTAFRERNTHTLIHAADRYYL